MKVKKIIQGVEGIEIKGNKDLEIMGLSCHSKLVQPGDLFIVKKAALNLSHDVVQEALLSGAVCILSDMYNPFLNHVCQLIHPDPDAIEPLLASNFYVHTKEISKFFITGTNGKTTTSYMLHYLLEELGQKTGLLTTIARSCGSNCCPAKLTTEDLITNYKDLHLMQAKGCQNAVIEASSHGILQGRIKGIEAKCAIFTNLSHDHLDYHANMQEYLEAKLMLLDNLASPDSAVYNLDCPCLSNAFKDTKASSFSLHNPLANLFVVASTNKSITVQYAEQKEELFFDALGQHNVQNALAAILALLLQGFYLSDFKDLFRGFCLPDGRLSQVNLENGAEVFIDFAHTPAALEATLKALKIRACHKLYLVFGCGGNRDKAKREDMVQVACQYADHLVFTSDNPRDEPIMNIIEEMKKGLDSKTSFDLIEDRKEAITLTLKRLKKGDVLLISGKGHEQLQIIKGHKFEFNDKSIVQKWAKDLDLAHV